MSGHEKNPPPFPATAAGLGNEADRLGAQLKELHRAQGISRYIMLALVLVVVIEFAVFYYATRRNLEANFSSGSIQQAMAQRLPQIAPQLRDMLVTAGQNALPVYRRLAVDRFTEAGPAIAKDAVVQIQNLPQDVGDELSLRLQKTFDGALARLQTDIQKTYPTLSDEQKRAVLQVALYDKIEQQNQAIQARLTSIEDREKARMMTILTKFEPPKLAEGTRGPNRERVFLHTLVDVLLDTDFQANLATEAIPAAPPANSAPMLPATQQAAANNQGN